MNNQERNSHPILSILNSSLTDLPSPASISYIWNMGFLLAACLGLQIVTGILISIHYVPSTQEAFHSVIHITRDVSNGWIIRFLHINGASLFFILIYAHISRGILFNSPSTRPIVWSSGLLLLILVIATAFLGYVLPWGQISFWGATVITNIFSAIPYVGTTLVNWIWGNFSVSQPTLNRFFSLHFLVPIIVAAATILHLIFLHQTGSSNPMGTNTNLDNVTFHPYFSTNDFIPIVVVTVAILLLVSNDPNALGDPENYSPANPISTPVHIQPEWYFLFAYAILRSVPSNLGGVIALIISLLALVVNILNNENSESSNFNPHKNILFWTFSGLFLALTWIGANPVEAPYENTGQVLSVLYFLNLAIIS